MYAPAIVLFLFSMVLASERSLNRTDLKCMGHAYHNVSLSAYYPKFGTTDKRNHLDNEGNKLRTLQDFLERRSKYITVAADMRAGIPYGTKVCIEELNRLFDRQVPLEIRDQIKGDSDEILGESIKICVRNRKYVNENYLNGQVTIYV